MRVIYTPIYIIHVILCPRTFYFQYIVRELAYILYTLILF